MQLKKQIIILRPGLIIILFFILQGYLSGQDYSIDASALHKELKSGHLKMGNPGPAGKDTPQKAIGFKIAGELFRNPLFKRDRENEKKPFEMKGLKISYTEDISELATNELFYHTNNTTTIPPSLPTLKSIAGYGTSPVVSYKGYGAYFLDKISDGVWRLEVMPDAIWVRDYPGSVEGPTSSWEYYNPDLYSVRVLPAASEVQLFNAETAAQALTFSGNSRFRSSLLLSGVTGESRLRFAPGASNFGPGRPNTSGLIYAMQNYVGNITGGISKYADKYTQILLHGKATEKPVKVEVTLINKDGNAYTLKSTLTADKDVQVLNLKDITDGRLLLLPRPYPGFLPLWYTAKTKKPFSLSEIERIQLLVPVDGNEELPGFELTSLTLK